MASIAVQSIIGRTAATLGGRLLLFLFRLAGGTTGDLDEKIGFLCEFFRLFYTDFAFVLSFVYVRIIAGKERDIAADVCVVCQCRYRTRRTLVYAKNSSVLGRSPSNVGTFSFACGRV